jgi:hypothetical protein
MKKKILFLLAYFALFHAIQGYSQWRKVNFNRSAVRTIITDNKGHLFAISETDSINYHTTIFFTADNGRTWEAREKGLTPNVLYIYSLNSQGDSIYAATDAGLFLSSNAGLEWSKCDTPTNYLSKVELKDSVIAIGDALYTYISTDRGINWLDLHTESGNIRKHVYAFHIRDTIVWVGGDGLDPLVGWCYQMGKWRPSYVSPVCYQIISNERYMFILGDSSMIFRTEEPLKYNWTKLGGGLQQDAISLLVAIGTYVFAGGGGSAGPIANVSKDDGDTWQSIGIGLPSNPNRVNGFVILQDTLYVSLMYDGIWYRPLADMGLGTDKGLGVSPQSYALEQNHPNPFTGQTLIKYQTPTYGKASIIVYDLLGRPVKTLVDEMKEPGEYTAGFDASGLPAGIYMYTLTAGSTRLTKKMCLMKY